MPEEKKQITVELGGSGTTKWHGIIDEDYNPELQFPQNTKVYDKMRKGDGTVSAILKAVKLPILGGTWSFTPASKEEIDIEKAEFCTKVFKENIKWNDFLRHALLSLDFGFMLFEKVYAIKDNKIVYSKLAPRLPKSIQEWRTQEGKEGITQQVIIDDEFKTVSIPWEKLVHFALDQEGDNYEGVSVLRTAYKHWYFKENFYKIQSIGAERNSVGIPVAKAPENRTLGTKEKATIEKTLKNIRANEKAYILEQGGIEFRFETCGDTGFDFEQPINHHDRQISKCVLAQFLELGTSAGSRALSMDHSNLFYVAVNGFVNYVKEVVQNDLIKEIIDLNYDNTEEYPTLTVSDIGKREFNDFSLAIERLTKSGHISPDDITEDHLRTLLKLPKKEESNDVEKKEEEKKNPKDIDEEIKKKDEKLSLADTWHRPLTLAEEKVDFKKIKKILDQADEKLKKTFEKNSKKIQKEIEKGVSSFIKTGDPELSSKELKEIEKSFAKELEEQTSDMFEVGKTEATRELEQKRIPTDPEDKKIIKAKSQTISSKHIEDLTNEAKLATLAGLSDKKKDSEILAGAVSAMSTKAARQIDAAIKVTTNGAFNQGIGTVYDNYKDDIWGYQYSAILDGKTCFPKNTKITTKEGQKNIEDVKEGDLILTRKGFKKVLGTFNKKVYEKLYKICSGDYSVECTGNHPFWTIEGKWIKAENLKIGDDIVNLGCDILSEIFSRVDFDFSNPQDIESFFIEKGISFDMLSCVSMPITSIHLNA